MAHYLGSVDANWKRHARIPRGTTAHVARMERSVIREIFPRIENPDFAALHPGSKRLLHRVEAPGQNALLRVQAVFGLVEHHRLRAVDHFIGDLLAAMGGQAVHEQRIGLGQ